MHFIHVKVTPSLFKGSFDLELQAWGYWFELCMTVWYAVPLACWMDNVNMFRILSIVYERQVKNRADKSMCIWKIQILKNGTTKGSCLQEDDFRCEFLSFDTAQPEQIQLMCVIWAGDTIAVGCSRALTSVPENSQPKGQDQLCNFWQKKRDCICCDLNWSRFTLGIRLISLYHQGGYDL